MDIIKKHSYNSNSSVCYPHWISSWNYNTKSMLKNSFIKDYWIQHGFEAEHDTNNRNISRYEITKLLVIWFLFLYFAKRAKKEFRTNYRKKVSYKNVSQIANKTLYYHWSHGTQNCKQDIFKPRLLGFSDLFGKMFFNTFKFS